MRKIFILICCFAALYCQADSAFSKQKESRFSIQCINPSNNTLNNGYLKILNLGRSFLIYIVVNDKIKGFIGDAGKKARLSLIALLNKAYRKMKAPKKGEKKVIGFFKGITNTHLAVANYRTYAGKPICVFQFIQVDSNGKAKAGFVSAIVSKVELKKLIHLLKKTLF